VKNTASPWKKKILTDLPVTSIRIEDHGPSYDFDGNGQSLFIDLGRQLIQIEEMIAAENHDASIGPRGEKIGKAGGSSNRNSSLRGDLLYKLRSLLKYIFRTEDAPFRLLDHLGEVKFFLRRKRPGNNAAPPPRERIDPDFGWD
jgi:hypothetical protein